MSKEIKFKEGLERLEEIVSKMENDEYELEELLERFQEGIKLYKELEKKLNNIEEKINEVMKSENSEEAKDDDEDIPF